MIRIQWNSPFGGSGLDLISDLLGTHMWTKLSNFSPSGQDFLSIPGATWVTRSKVDCCLCLMLCLLHTHKNTERRATEEGYDGRICEMNAEGPTDVSVPPFNRKEWITTCVSWGQRDRERETTFLFQKQRVPDFQACRFILNRLFTADISTWRLYQSFFPQPLEILFAMNAWSQISDPFAQRGQELCRYCVLVAAIPTM